MSKRHQAQQRRRTVDGFRLRGPRYDIRESRSVAKYDHRGHTEITRWYVVVDRETDEPASEEFSDWRHARQLADRLNGSQRRDEREKQRERRNLASTRPLHRRVEHILNVARVITGGCPRHKTPPMLSVHAEDDGAVLVRPSRHMTSTWSRLETSDSDDRQRLESFWLVGCEKVLTKAGLFATGERDMRGPFVRVREL